MRQPKCSDFTIFKRKNLCFNKPNEPVPIGNENSSSGETYNDNMEQDEFDDSERWESHEDGQYAQPTDNVLGSARHSLVWISDAEKLRRRFNRLQTRAYRLCIAISRKAGYRRQFPMNVSKYIKVLIKMKENEIRYLKKKIQLREAAIREAKQSSLKCQAVRDEVVPHDNALFQQYMALPVPSPSACPPYSFKYKVQGEGDGLSAVFGQDNCFNQRPSNTDTDAQDNWPTITDYRKAKASANPSTEWAPRQHTANSLRFLPPSNVDIASQEDQNTSRGFWDLIPVQKDEKMLQKNHNGAPEEFSLSQMRRFNPGLERLIQSIDDD